MMAELSFLGEPQLLRRTIYLWRMNKTSKGKRTSFGLEKLIRVHVPILSGDVLVSYLRVSDVVVDNIISIVCAKNIYYINKIYTVLHYFTYVQ